MKSRTSHLIHLLVWLLVLTAYVVVLNGLPPGSRSSAHHPCGVGWDCRGPGVVGLSDHEETRGPECAYHLSFSIFARKQMGSPWNTPSVPRRARARLGRRRTGPGGVSDSAGRSASMAPVFFPVFLPAQGGPGGAGPGFAFDGRSPSGSGTRWACCSCRACWALGADGGVWSCFRISAWSRLGLTAPGARCRREEAGRTSGLSNAAGERHRPHNLGLCPKGNLADLVQAFLFPFVKPHPEGSLEGDGEGGNCRFHLGSSFLGSYGEGTTKEAGY